VSIRRGALHDCDEHARKRPADVIADLGYGAGREDQSWEINDIVPMLKDIGENRTAGENKTRRTA